MRVAVIGLGLMGASLCKAIKAYTAYEVFGYDSDEETMRKADEKAIYDGRIDKENLKTADVVVFALRPSTVLEVLPKYCPYLRDGATVMDVCGNKRIILDGMKSLQKKFPRLHFVGTHPMAGKEVGGIDNSSADLYKNAYAVIVPSDDKFAAEIAKTLYLAIGVKDVQIATPEEHDRMIAYTSQLAHVASSCYVQNPLSKTHRGFSAGSFADFTRVARLDADMWTELFLQNADNLSDSIEDLTDRLEQIRFALKSRDAERLKIILDYGNKCKNEADDDDRD